jgi:alpha-glucosidase (family GH31 glycosyl hydrolase)
MITLECGKHKNWQVFFTALAFSCLEGYRDFSPLKRVMIFKELGKNGKQVSSSSWSGDDYAKLFKQFCIDL